jgi:hypothetical protein
MGAQALHTPLRTPWELMTTAPPHHAASTDDTPAQYARLIRWRDAARDRLCVWFARADAVLAHDRVWLLAVALTLALQTLLTALHRPWLDEWQALQLAVQSPHVSDLMFSLRYEGHPPLWYLILRALAAWFPDPVYALPVAALLIAIPVQAAILFGAPFSRAERLMIALSEFVLFEYLTLSRSLTLGVAVMLAIALVWPRRRLVWLLIAILPLCDFLFGVVSVLFAALLWRERRVFGPFVVLWLVCGVFAAWSVRPMPDIVTALATRGLGQDIPAWLAKMGTLGLPLQWQSLQPGWNAPPPGLLRGPALVGFMAVACVELRNSRASLAAFGAFVVVLLVFSLAVYPLAIRHLSLAALLLIVLVWRLALQGGTRSVWWRAWLLVLALCGLFTATIALIEPFDTAPEAAAMIERMGLRDKTWVPFPQSAGQDIAALDSIVFERLSQHCSEDFVRWNVADDHAIHTFADLRARLVRKVQADGRFYLLTTYDLAEDQPLVHRIAAVPPGYDRENYYLFMIGENRPEARPHALLCNGRHPPLRPARPGHLLNGY